MLLYFFALKERLVSLIQNSKFKLNYFLMRAFLILNHQLFSTSAIDAINYDKLNRIFTSKTLIKLAI